jgi:hypothetical protein
MTARRLRQIPSAKSAAISGNQSTDDSCIEDELVAALPWFVPRSFVKGEPDQPLPK